MSVAIVEDDDVIRENYADLLTQAGFNVTAYSSKEAAWRGFSQSLPELALLDITLGRERDAGFDLCAELRRLSPTLPIVFLTSHDAEVDKISGLRLGADDYITKDVSIDYLIVRLEALFRRRAALTSLRPSGETQPRLGSTSSLVIDEDLSVVAWRGVRVSMPLTQVWMLRALASQPGVVLSHADLMSAAKIVVEPNTITAHVKAIRDALRLVDSTFDGIRTERGRGYRWLA